MLENDFITKHLVCRRSHAAATCMPLRDCMHTMQATSSRRTKLTCPWRKLLCLECRVAKLAPAFEGHGTVSMSTRTGQGVAVCAVCSGCQAGRQSMQNVSTSAQPRRLNLGRC